MNPTIYDNTVRGLKCDIGPRMADLGDFIISFESKHTGPKYSAWIWLKLAQKDRVFYVKYSR